MELSEWQYAIDCLVKEEEDVKPTKRNTTRRVDMSCLLVMITVLLTLKTTKPTWRAGRVTNELTTSFG